MKNFKINQIDYRYLLVDTYKSLGLSENDLALLLLVDNILKEMPTLITAEILALKMNLDVKEIDKIIVSLMNRGFLEYTEASGNGLCTSIAPLYKRLGDNFVKEVITESTIEDNKQKHQAVSNIYATFEKEFGRSLTGLELEKIRNWIGEGIEESLIIDSLHECQSKYKNVTIRQIDKVIIKRMTSNDVNKEGYSPVSSSCHTNVDSLVEIVNTKWIND